MMIQSGIREIAATEDIFNNCSTKTCVSSKAILDVSTA